MCEGQVSRKRSEQLKGLEVEEQLLQIESRLQLEEPSLQDQLQVQGRAKLGARSSNTSSGSCSEP